MEKNWKKVNPSIRKGRQEVNLPRDMYCKPGTWDILKAWDIVPQKCNFKGPLIPCALPKGLFLRKPNCDNVCEIQNIDGGVIAKAYIPPVGSSVKPNMQAMPRICIEARIDREEKYVYALFWYEKTIGYITKLYYYKSDLEIPGLEEKAKKDVHKEIVRLGYSKHQSPSAYWGWRLDDVKDCYVPIPDDIECSRTYIYTENVQYKEKSVLYVFSYLTKKRRAFDGFSLSSMYDVVNKEISVIDSPNIFYRFTINLLPYCTAILIEFDKHGNWRPKARTWKQACKGIQAPIREIRKIIRSLDPERASELDAGSKLNNEKVVD